MDSIYSEVTQNIINALKSCGELEMPWNNFETLPINAKSSDRYQGVNVLILGLKALEMEYSYNEWATYKQWKELGGQVKKGEKGTTIIFYKKKVVKDKDSEEEKTIPILKKFSVFNFDQVEGIEKNIEKNIKSDVEIIKSADEFIAGTKARIIHGDNGSCYNISKDVIEMMRKERFISTSTSNATQNYYSVLLHELVHWTGHKSRCDRDMKNRFGSEAYSAEELVAELGSSFLCKELGVSYETRVDHAKYIKSWLKVLGNDPRAIFTASAKAEEAVKFLNEIQVKEKIAA